LPQKIRLPLISFLFGVNYIWGSYIWGSSSKNQTGPDFFFLWSQLHLGKLCLEEFFGHCPDRQTDTTVALIYNINENTVIDN
jgi:hypothetical protein